MNNDPTFDRGTFASLDGVAIRELCHTIARIGAVDERVHGSNGHYSDVAVLHEPWIAQPGLAIDDPAYFRAYADTLDFQREHALALDGRVKSRWAGTPGDAMPGSFDAHGFYEAQWGYLMDSQPSWVINIAELFDFTGDQAWLAHQKAACERALEYLLRRDANGNGLVEMLTDSHQQARGSDWIDVVWAAHENALVNNCSIIVGLYRNLCGVQPKYNRLYLEPHLPAELTGTQLKYQLRGQTYVITPHPNGCRVAVDGVVVQDRKPFAMNVTREAVEYFSGGRKAPSLTIAGNAGATLEVRVEVWPGDGEGDGARKWIESGASGPQHVVSDLLPNATYTPHLNDPAGKTIRSDPFGHVAFDSAAGDATPLTIELRPQ